MTLLYLIYKIVLMSVGAKASFFSTNQSADFDPWTSEHDTDDSEGDFLI